MVSLQVLKFEGNPITFPPQEVLQVQARISFHEGLLEREAKEVIVTERIKEYFKSRTMNVNHSVEGDIDGDDPNDDGETPRLLTRRVGMGRFPIKVNSIGAPSHRSPTSRPPPIPPMSHSRRLSQHRSGVRQPESSLSSSRIVNEKLWSNSKILQVPLGEVPEKRTRRVGTVSKKAPGLQVLPETQFHNQHRYHHYRGLSYSSALADGRRSRSLTSPASPMEPSVDRPLYVRQLSIMPITHHDHPVLDPILEVAQGILYSVFQIHWIIQVLANLTNGGTTKRSSLEMIVYNTNIYLEKLEEEVQKHCHASQRTLGPREKENLQEACRAVLNAYGQICSNFTSNIDLILDNGDQRYCRTFLLLLYSSIIELHLTIRPPITGKAATHDTTRPYSSSDSSRQTLKTTELTGSTKSHSSTSNQQGVANIQTPDMDRIQHATSSLSAITDSQKSFATLSSTSGGDTELDSNEDGLFERLFLTFQTSSKLVLQILPRLYSQIIQDLKGTGQQRFTSKDVQHLKSLVSQCSTVMQQAETLSDALPSVRLSGPSLGVDAPFWRRCNSFIASWANFGTQIKICRHITTLSRDVRDGLPRIQRLVKESTDLMILWSRQWSLSHPTHSPTGLTYQPENPGPAPVTPLSAALGPAAQATVSCVSYPNSLQHLL